MLPKALRLMATLHFVAAAALAWAAMPAQQPMRYDAVLRTFVPAPWHGETLAFGFAALIAGLLLLAQAATVRHLSVMADALTDLAARDAHRERLAREAAWANEAKARATLKER